MERIFACISSDLIVNTIVADDAFVELIRADFDDVREITDTDPRPGVNWTVHGDEYRPPSPFPSWVWVDGEWVAPVPRPDGSGWVWDEDSQEWIDVTPEGEPADDPVDE